jgi:hypothetical protein
VYTQHPDKKRHASEEACLKGFRALGRKTKKAKR